MNITNLSFKLKDSLYGSKIRIHYKDIENHFESQNDLSSQALERILLHVVKNVPYYRNIDFTSLNNFLIINKTIIKSNFNEFRANNFN